MILVKFFGAYLLTSLMALMTLQAIQDIGSSWKIIAFPLVGAFALFMGFASNIYEQRKEASMNYDYALMAQIEKNELYDLMIMFGSVVLFVLILFIPAIAINILNEWLLGIIQWIYNLPIIGWLIGIGGVLYMLNIIFYGLIISGTLLVGFYTKLREQKGESDTEQRTIEMTKPEVYEGSVEISKRYCPSCGNEITLSGKFCRFCGKQLNQKYVL
jgi:hypothetical protein